MIVTLAAALILAPQTPNASATITKMLTKYHEASTISGRVAFSQSAGGAKVTITSEIYAKKPNLFSIRQTRTPASAGGLNEMLAVGDGVRLGYPAPAGSATFLISNPNRFFEKSHDTLDKNFEAFNGMLLDRSLCVAVGLYSPSEIHATIGRLRDLKISEADSGDRKVWRIDFQLVVSNALPAEPARGLPAKPEGRIGGVMTISKDHDLLSVAWREKVGTKEQQVDVLSQWTAALLVNKPIDASVFKVR
jgi:hypothetical protein